MEIKTKLNILDYYMESFLELPFIDDIPELAKKRLFEKLENEALHFSFNISGVNGFFLGMRTKWCSEKINEQIRIKRNRCFNYV